MFSQKRQPQFEGLSERAVDILRLLDEGLTDRDIAERLVLTINTVKWYNRQIYSVLGVGSRTQAIARAHELRLLESAAESDAADSTPPLQIVRRATEHNLPHETTRFIGRKNQIDDIKQLLDNTRLLTLVGTPGTGKTRLSLQIAREMMNSFKDGIYFVSLAPLNDPTLVINAIASAIGVIEARGKPLIDSVKQMLRERHLLLILDNFEHLLSAATQVSQLLSAAPQLKVLTTSREPLHLYGEQEYAVPTLQLPAAEHFAPQELASCESTALFVQQARAVRSDFELTEENAADVAQICLRLEGLPLAIELAAARSKLLTPRALLARLSSRLDTLTGGAQDLPPRHQTLQNTIAWSYNLLSDAEKKLFARLAVFKGGYSLEAVEAVCSDDLPLDIFEGFASLVDKSLIQQKDSLVDEPRFTMLETIHEYARERLKESGEAQIIARRHAEYFVRLAERAEPELRLAQQRYWFRLLETDYENLRTVLQWSIPNGGDITLGARLVGALYLFWYAYGHHSEGQNWGQQFFARLDTIPAQYRAKLLVAVGHMTMLYDLDSAKVYFEIALPYARELDDKTQLAWALGFLSYTMMRDTERGLTVADEALALFRKLNHKPGIAQVLNIIGELARYKGDDEHARRVYEECLIVSQETGEKRRIGFLLSNLSFIAQHEGDYARALELGDQSLQLAIEMDNRLDIADVLAGLAGILGATGEPELAARLFGTWEAALERLGAVALPSNLHEFERSIDAVRTQLSPDIFAAEWAAGRTLTLEQAAALVLENKTG